MKNDTGKLRTYKKEHDYSYSIGAYPTIELLKSRPDAVKEVYVHSKCRDCALIEQMMGSRIPVVRDDRVFDKIGAAGNSYVFGVFYKYEKPLLATRAHIVLVNPGDMGNLGTIIRTIAGLGYKDLAVIRPAADIFDPKTVRASMGALFRINFEYFESFEEYMAAFPLHELFLFMSDAKKALSAGTIPGSGMFSLIFGNEASGLDERFRAFGTPVRIRQTFDVDSFNLASATAIGAYVFAQNCGILGGE